MPFIRLFQDLGESPAGGAIIRRWTLRENRSCDEAEAHAFRRWVLSRTPKPVACNIGAGGFEEDTSLIQIHGVSLQGIIKNPQGIIKKRILTQRCERQQVHGRLATITDP